MDLDEEDDGIGSGGEQLEGEVSPSPSPTISTKHPAYCTPHVRSSVPMKDCANCTYLVIGIPDCPDHCCKMCAKYPATHGKKCRHIHKDQEPYSHGMPFEDNCCEMYPFGLPIHHSKANGRRCITVSLLLEDSEMVDYLFERQASGKTIKFGTTGHASTVTSINFHGGHPNTLWIDAQGVNEKSKPQVEDLMTIIDRMCWRIKQRNINKSSGQDVQPRRPRKRARASSQEAESQPLNEKQLTELIDSELD